MNVAPSAAARAGKKKRPALSRSNRKKNLWLMTMVAPGAVWLLLIRYLPMFGIVIAFKNYRAFKPNTFWNNIIKSDWVGLKNFEFLKFPDTAVMIRNTLGYNLLWIVLGLVIAVAFAIMMSELRNRFAAKAYQTMMFFPYFLSWVVASYFVMAFLDPTSGMIPALQKSMGIKPTNFYHDTTYWPLILTLCSMWKNIGYSSVLYLAAITGIDTSLYEAAAVDGATKWQQVKNITLPSILPTISILFILAVAGILGNDYQKILLMYSPRTYSTADVVNTYVYRYGIETAGNHLSYSSAVGLLVNVVSLIFLFIANTVPGKLSETSLF